MSAVLTIPIEASAMATGLPPGTRRTSGPAGRLCKRIMAPKMKRKGRSVERTVMLTSTS